MIGHPVERRGREDGVDPPLDRQGIAEISQDEIDTARGGRESPAGFLEHRRRDIEGDHAAPRQPLQKVFRDPPRTAAGIQHPLVASQHEAVDDLASPARLGIGHPIVGRRGPLANHLGSLDDSGRATRVLGGHETPCPLVRRG